ncbi:hypothetical protein GOBAR_DD16212 [Gossypium barbadense]|nr:hypothetical protein GOBAR_DD16212 [Gossypium barbadense]
MARLESDMEGQMNTSFRQWLGTMEPWQWAQSFDEGFCYGQMTTNLVEGINAVLLKTGHLSLSSVFSAKFYRLATLMPRMARSMTIKVYSRRNETFRVTETISHRPACAKVSLNVEQFIDEVYTIECMLRVWENEFPVLPDLSTWEGYIFVELDVHVAGDYGDQHSRHSYVGMPSMNLNREEWSAAMDTGRKGQSTKVDTSRKEWSTEVDTS